MICTNSLSVDTLVIVMCGEGIQRWKREDMQEDNSTVSGGHSGILDRLLCGMAKRSIDVVKAKRVTVDSV